MNVRFLTQPGEVSAKWAQIAPLLAPVVEKAARGEFTLDDIRRLCEQGRMVMGLCEYGNAVVMAMAFEFKHYPQYMNLNIVAIGGTGLQMVASNYWQLFREWAKEAGAHEIEALCSKPMARLLNGYGFNNTYEQVRLPV
jgi:hypothetical protein